jgi:predicted DNA-binding transcriptional regulator AlpA
MRLLRYKDLHEMGIAGSRPTLDRNIKNLGFPPGRLLSPNVRVWTEEEVEAWIVSRPTGRKAVPARAKENYDVRKKVEPVGGDRQAR